MTDEKTRFFEGKDPCDEGAPKENQLSQMPLLLCDLG
jgi:hypothetical protein